MRFPLLWKEGRESGLALGFGLLWIIGAVEFWLKWGNLKVPGAVHGLLLAFAMVGPLACIVLLSVARFATERHRGTWDFLRALPVPPRRIVASKWVVATGLGTLVIAASSGLAWYPIIHLEPLFGHVGLLHWVAFHCAALVVLLSLLLLLDTLHWGDWLGLRALATFAVLLAFQAAMRSGTYDSWWPTIACLSAAAACAGPAVAFAPRLLGESPLPAWSFQAIARERHFGRGRAWIWMQWTQLRFIVPLLLVPIPMIFAIQTLPRLAAGENLWSGADWLPVFRVAAGYVQFSLCLAAAVLGLALTLMNGRSGGDTFRASLPISRGRVRWLRVCLGLLLLAVVAIPAVAVVAVRASWLEPHRAGILAENLGLQLIRAVAVFAIMMAVGSALPSKNPGRDVLAVSVCLGVAGVLCGWTPASPMILIATAVAAVVAAFWAGSHLERRRQV